MFLLLFYRSLHLVGFLLEVIHARSFHPSSEDLETTNCCDFPTLVIFHEERQAFYSLKAHEFELNRFRRFFQLVRRQMKSLRGVYILPILKSNVFSVNKYMDLAWVRLGIYSIVEFNELNRSYLQNDGD